MSPEMRRLRPPRRSGSPSWLSGQRTCGERRVVEALQGPRRAGRLRRVAVEVPARVGVSGWSKSRADRTVRGGECRRPWPRPGWPSGRRSSRAPRAARPLTLGCAAPPPRFIPVQDNGAATSLTCLATARWQVGQADVVEQAVRSRSRGGLPPAGPAATRPNPPAGLDILAVTARL